LSEEHDAYMWAPVYKALSSPITARTRVILREYQRDLLASE